jgi:polyphosphate glucokinase
MTGSAGGPSTLAVDIGGTGIKATVLDSAGTPVASVLRVATTYPCPPSRLAEQVSALAAELPRADRAGVGFPGLLRSGRVVQVNSLRRATPDGPPDPGLVAAWTGCHVGEVLADVLGLPVRVANDADVQALASVRGDGLECVLTLGTGLGFSLVQDGALLPHLELSGAPFGDGRDFEGALGDAALRTDGEAAWLASVHRAVDVLRPFVFFDRLYLGGGNARLVDPTSLPADVEVVGNVNGLLGAHLLFRS